MKNNKSIEEIELSIQKLQEKQVFNGKLLIEQFQITYNSLKPANLLKSTLGEVAASPYLLDNILNTTVGLATGYLSKKLVVAGSHNKFRMLLGSMLQFGITKLVSKNPDAIQSLSQFVVKVISHKKEKKHAVAKKKVESENHPV